MPRSTRRPTTHLTPEQKRLFRAAMVYFGYTRETWARQHGISAGYLDAVRGGFERSDRVLGQVVDTISRFRAAVSAEHLARSA